MLRFFLGIAILFFLFNSSKAQNLTAEETVKYIREKLQIADPVFSDFKMGENGEVVMKWVTRNIYTEYRFNIREIEIELKLTSDGDNYLELTCISGTNNCMQNASRKKTNQVGDDVNFGYYQKLTIKSIAGFDNITSLKNALKYLKIISVENNDGTNSSDKDPFLY